MKLNLQGKQALITGSNVGIGKAIALTLVREGSKAFGFAGDLSTDEGAAYVARQAQESLGGVDIPIDNADYRIDRESATCIN